MKPSDTHDDDFHDTATSCSKLHRDQSNHSPFDIIASSPLEAPKQPKVNFPLRFFGKGRPRAFNISLFLGWSIQFLLMLLFVILADYSVVAVEVRGSLL